MIIFIQWCKPSMQDRYKIHPFRAVSTLFTSGLMERLAAWLSLRSLILSVSWQVQPSSSCWDKACTLSLFETCVIITKNLYHCPQISFNSTATFLPCYRWSEKILFRFAIKGMRFVVNLPAIYIKRLKTEY